MKQKLRDLLIKAAAEWKPLPPFEIEKPKVEAHGELSTNLALLLAKSAGQKPQEIAQKIAEKILREDTQKILSSATVAGGGFLNFVFKKSAWQESLRDIGKSTVVPGHKGEALVEFVSANPTGPLHIGNARGGPLGDVLAGLLEATGYRVTREFYVNDVGGQIDKLGQSLLHWIREKDNEAALPPEGYQGDYVKEIAREAEIALGEKIKSMTDTESVPVLGRFGIDRMMHEIRKDCEDMGIRFDSWIHEKEVLARETEKILNELKSKKVTLEKEGAIWFAFNPPSTGKAGSSGSKSGENPDSPPNPHRDEESHDRESVLIRSDGRPTYFANDIAYHAGKYRRGFDRVINVWGSNHHGHVPRLAAAMQSLGFDPGKMETILYQYVRVKKGADAVKMSKRGGNFVTAREVLDEVGRDAFRFFLLLRSAESHLDFDLDLAVKHTQENPVYYVQYAHARIASILRKAHEQKIPVPKENSVRLDLLDLSEEIVLIRALHRYPEEVALAASRLEPHRIPHYLLDLAKLFQAYYSKAREDERYRVLSPDVDTSQAKMYLCAAVKKILFQGLNLIGVSAPEVMNQAIE